MVFQFPLAKYAQPDYRNVVEYEMLSCLWVSFYYAMYDHDFLKLKHNVLMKFLQHALIDEAGEIGVRLKIHLFRVLSIGNYGTYPLAKSWVSQHCLEVLLACQPGGKHLVGEKKE